MSKFIVIVLVLIVAASEFQPIPASAADPRAEFLMRSVQGLQALRSQLDQEALTIGSAVGSSLKKVPVGDFLDSLPTSDKQMREAAQPIIDKWVEGETLTVVAREHGVTLTRKYDLSTLTKPAAAAVGTLGVVGGAALVSESLQITGPRK